MNRHALLFPLMLGCAGLALAMVGLAISFGVLLGLFR